MNITRPRAIASPTQVLLAPQWLGVKSVKMVQAFLLLRAVAGHIHGPGFQGPMHCFADPITFDLNLVAEPHLFRQGQTLSLEGKVSPFSRVRRAASTKTSHGCYIHAKAAIIT
jgi:hypothetical protein